mmetsp:Transcript_26534/g.64671  ORF Transcript_26534/g.64671 Transcript_26534/m.64671 type:complete len:484 (+) Transcript_26534:125-1576(+)
MTETAEDSRDALQGLDSDTDDEDVELDFKCGELRMLSETFIPLDGDTTSESTVSAESVGSRVNSGNSENLEALYGPLLDADQAAAAVPEGKEGLVWHAIVIPDDFIVNGKLVSGLNKRDFDLQAHEIKPRRASLPVTQTQLFSALSKVEGSKGPRFIFNGVLNGWPGLKTFELVRLEFKRSLGPLVAAPDYMKSFAKIWGHHWSVAQEGAAGVAPEIKDKSKIYRATLRAAPWTREGWAPGNLGHVFWFEAQKETPTLQYGCSMVATVGDEKCTAVHMISHRYYVAKESAKDKLTYHSVVLLEWEHGKYCTLVEGAYLNGIGGYKGKSNWYDDRDEPVTALYKALPNEMIQPWLSSASEIRLYDIESRNLDEFKQYIEKYVGSRFTDPHYTFSHPARLFYRSRSHIAQYLINYISRDGNYSEIDRNCQTLAADLCSFLAGKKGVVPFHPVNRFEYNNRAHLFLYDSEMYENKSKKKGMGIFFG